MRRAPLLPIALAIGGGIVVAHTWGGSVATWLWSLAVCTAAIGIALIACPKAPRLVLYPSLLFCFTLGGATFALRTHNDWYHSCPEEARLLVHLDETPQPRYRYLRTKATVISINNQHTTGSITLYLRNDSTAHTLRYGDRLLLHGHPDTARRIVRTTANHYLVLQHDHTSLRARSEALRLRLLGRMQSGPLPAKQTGIAEALTLGWRANLDNDTQQAFRDAGIAHLLAVSGLHVGLLVAAIRILLLPIGRERRGRTISGLSQLLAVWLFTLLSGMTPPTMRAALMFSLFIVADIAGRRTPKINLLAATAIATLLSQPTLIFDLGWQLSYSAVGGILIARPIISLFHSQLWQSATVSVVATLSTLPIALATFHRLPLYFLIANVAIVPLSGLMLILSIAYMVWPVCALAWPLSKLISACEWIAAQVATLPGAIIEGIEPSPIGIAVLTVGVIALLLTSHLADQRET